MRIDPKYFNVFLLVVAVVAAALIAYVIISNRSAEKADFKQRMFAQDSLQTTWWNNVQSDDSLQISDFKGQYVVLDLWSDWSNTSLESHRELSSLKEKFPNKIEVIAAAVGMEKKAVDQYIEQHQFSFRYVAGSQQFGSFNMPGLPVQFIYGPKLDLKHVFLGYSNDTQYDSLRVLINDEYSE